MPLTSKKDIEEIIKETGLLHEILNTALNEYMGGDEISGKVYERTIARMERQRAYSNKAMEFYRHAFLSAKTVYELNKGEIKNG